MPKIICNISTKLVVLALLQALCCLTPAMSFNQECGAGARTNLSGRISIYSSGIEQAFSKAAQNPALLAKASALPQVKTQKPIQTHLPEEKYLVLFICNANQERSPMSSWLTGINMPADLRDYFTVTSAGLRPAVLNDYVLNDYLLRRPLELRRYHSNPVIVKETQLQEARIIYVMTRRQRTKLIDKYPYLTNKVFLLMGEEQPGIHAGNGDYAARGKTYQTLQKAITERLPAIYEQMRQTLAVELGVNHTIEPETVSTHAAASNDRLISSAI